MDGSQTRTETPGYTTRQRKLLLFQHKRHFRSIRKWWTALPQNRRLLLRQWVLGHRWHLAAGGGVALLIAALLLLTHLDESPVTGRVRLLVFSRETYLELAALTSETYMEEFAEHLLPVTHPLHQMVEQSVELLVQKNKDILEVSDVPWSVHVVESPQINAFVLPNGKVFMFTGMLESVTDVDQLMIVLGHEMAHAILEHSAEQASLSHVVDLLSLILLTAIWVLCPGDSLALLGGWAKDKLTQLMFSHPYSRKLEAEADEVGLHLAAKACADVRAGPVFWQQLEIVDRLTGEPTLPEWLSTHPSHRNRSSQMDRLIPQALELRENCACPALSPVDPRAVFSETARVLLEKAKERKGGGLKGAHELRPASVPAEPPAPQSAPPSSSGVYRLGKGWAAASKTAVASPGPAAAREESQKVLQNNSQQGG
ncbi:metalloendopeptidase OMA1, mitochondrial isoform X2 [Kryptolebias marmoratus]|uniref:metalloendopeptidase OMA1, mitochondrial isoform X2 n=1 Tax=Kryptolebias marmoratus TaxID=37003 RepID=UPI0007F88C27|nr:metalloendopeptidase OMA1, mitochondrial isoform X2 [Kryptolebias marmoratus]